MMYIEKMTTNSTTNRYFKVSVWADSDKETDELVKSWLIRLGIHECYLTDGLLIIKEIYKQCSINKR